MKRLFFLFFLVSGSLVYADERPQPNICFIQCMAEDNPFLSVRIGQGQPPHPGNWIVAPQKVATLQQWFEGRLRRNQNRVRVFGALGNYVDAVMTDPVNKIGIAQIKYAAGVNGNYPGSEAYEGKFICTFYDWGPDYKCD